MARTAEKITRMPLCEAYVDNMTEYLVCTENISREEARQFAKDQLKYIKIPELKIQDTSKKGFQTIRNISLGNFVQYIQENILTPSGSVYYPTYKRRSIIAILIKEFKLERKAVKKQMFKEAAAGKKAAAKTLKALQNSIKVVLNSILGGYGSPGSILYDKGCYNGVTSSGRLLISYAFLCCEQLLSSNLALFNTEEAINFLIQIRRYTKRDLVLRVMTKYNLRQVEKEEVLDYLNSHVKRYSLTEDLSKNNTFMMLFNTLSLEHLQFIWYHGNLQHICFDNSELFVPKLKECFDVTSINTATIEYSIDNFWNSDMDLMAVSATILADEVDGRELAKIAETDPTIAARLMACTSRLQFMLSGFKDLFEVFIRHDMHFAQAMNRNVMQRENVIISDTDSVIFTVERWGTWFTNQNDVVTRDHYNISAFVVYMLNNAIEDAMAKFAISCGATGEDIAVISMKSEFTYPTFLAFEVKKVYAALLAAQEGLHYKELRTDIKGAMLKGVGSTTAKAFSKDFLVDKVLKTVLTNDISAIDLIQLVIETEDKIRQSLQRGELTYLPNTSVKTEDAYKNADSSTYYYAKAWNEIFGEDYGIIHPPDKPPKITILKPTTQYFEWLEKQNPKICKRFKTFLEKNNDRCPSSILIESRLTELPKELLPLIHTKAMIYNNLSACYLTLASLNIGLGHNDSSGPGKTYTLFGDIYDFGRTT